MPDPDAVVDLNAEAKLELIRTKATCPFIGSAIAEDLLRVRNAAGNPLASIDELRALGDQGRGELGDLLAMFAAGNHARMRDDAGQLILPVPPGLFSLDFPDSQGSHPGDSGILQGNPEGRGPDFSQAEFDRLARRARNGRLTRLAVGDFIAENVRRDPNARTIGKDVIVRVSRDLFALFQEAVPAALKKVLGRSEEASAGHRRATEKLTKLLAEDNIAGSSGEFGLLFTLLSREDGDEPAVLMEEVRRMFQEKRLPADWDQKKTTWIDWATHTVAILVCAYDSFTNPPKG